MTHLASSLAGFGSGGGRRKLEAVDDPSELDIASPEVEVLADEVASSGPNKEVQ